jgi:hypothetical protein
MITQHSLGARIARARARSHISHDVTSFDSGAVFLVKALFYPVTVVAFLALCLWLGNRSFSGTHFLMAVLVFAGAAELLGDSRIDHGEPDAALELRWFLDLVARWIAVGMFVALILYLSGLLIRPTDNVLLIWFVLTPFVLWSGTIGVRHLLLYVGVNHMGENCATAAAAHQTVGLF